MSVHYLQNTTCNIFLNTVAAKNKLFLAKLTWGLMGDDGGGDNGVVVILVVVVSMGYCVIVLFWYKFSKI